MDGVGDDGAADAPAPNPLDAIVLVGLVVVTPHLLQGADVHLSDDGQCAENGGIRRCSSTENETSVGLSLWHRRDGELFRGRTNNVRGERFDYVRVTVAWASTRPRTEEGERQLAAVSERIIEAAGRIAGNIGGYATASSHRTTYEQDTPYERLLGLRHMVGR